MAYDDKRSARRMRVLKDGKIVTMNNLSVIDCTVRDLSDTGARLRCQDQRAVPDEFRLLFPHERSIRPAKVVWRTHDQVGITFTGPAKPAPPRKW